jgi:rhodanese-related sulfurtransferase
MDLKRIAISAAAVALTAGSAFAQSGMMGPKPAGAKAAGAKAEMTMHAAGDTAKHEMTAGDLKMKLDKGEKVVVVDARTNVGTEMIKGAHHVPTSKLAEWAKDMDKETVIVTYCTCPHDEAAINEVNQLRGMGFTNAYSLAGGLAAARQVGIEIGAPAE